MSIKDTYNKEIISKLKKQLKISNTMAVPKIEKITINVGIGSYRQKHKNFDNVVSNIAAITGQKPLVVNSRVAISNFKLRKEMPVGVSVTLRRNKMYDFFEKLIKVIVPRMRDFRGFSKKSFDGRGNYCIGMNDFTIFPEVTIEDLSRNHGLQINIQTSAKNDEEGLALLTMFGFPFKKDKNTPNS